MGAVFIKNSESYTVAVPDIESISKFMQLMVDRLSISFSNMFVFFGLNDGPLEKLYEVYHINKCFWIFQTITGPVILFFLGLTLRNRFRMG